MSEDILPTISEEQKSYIRKVGHIFGLKDRDYADKLLFPRTCLQEKEGSCDEDAIPWFKTGLTDYLQHISKQSSIPNPPSQTTQLVKKVIENMLDALGTTVVGYNTIGNPTISVGNIIKKIRNNNPVIIPLVTKELITINGKQLFSTHSLTISIVTDSLDNKKKLVVSNRGIGGLEQKQSIGKDQFIGAYALEFNANLFSNNPKRFAQLINSITNPNNSPTTKTLNNVIRSITVPNQKPSFENWHLFSEQKTGNCCFANKKPLLYVFLLFSGMPQKQALQEYKKYTTFLRQSEIKNLIQDAKGDDPTKAQIAQELLLAILMKLTKKIKITSENDTELLLKHSELLYFLKNELNANGLNPLFAKLPENFEYKINIINNYHCKLVEDFSFQKDPLSKKLDKELQKNKNIFYSILYDLMKENKIQTINNLLSKHKEWIDFTIIIPMAFKLNKSIILGDIFNCIENRALVLYELAKKNDRVGIILFKKYTDNTSKYLEDLNEALTIAARNKDKVALSLLRNQIDKVATQEQIRLNQQKLMQPTTAKQGGDKQHALPDLPAPQPNKSTPPNPTLKIGKPPTHNPSKEKMKQRKSSEGKNTAISKLPAIPKAIPKLPPINQPNKRTPNTRRWR